jgi:hypothetical protein
MLHVLTGRFEVLLPTFFFAAALHIGENLVEILSDSGIVSR